MTNYPENDRISNRKAIFCPRTETWSVPMLVEECPECNTFFLYCCQCAPDKGEDDRPCHHFPIVFTDGACTNNGRPEAKAGIGIAYGIDTDSTLSLSITDAEDDFPVRSNQRAELCAAITGLKTLASIYVSKGAKRTSEANSKGLIVATDSEYVVKGMTEWLPAWKANNWRTSKGKTPVNLDLFVKLDELMTKYEAKGAAIGLWHIPREENRIADRLAKLAAVDGDVAGLLTLGGLTLAGE
ncbi:ribonuclease H-like protein [Lophiostoma macrostomum CBS 122681]|uniref:ribonuclease H n=1 Tax=Lophiostoma macrostomum CBS 122681 TaxID=1314788 RepID=A0A6A6TR47_9PLEO|nr:ribonuclease H-like protein [Lophiostoma macrostomum CBS 122681]